jgi:hypothetical protein
MLLCIIGLVCIVCAFPSGANPTTFEFTYSYNASVVLGLSVFKPEKTIFFLLKYAKLLVVNRSRRIKSWSQYYDHELQRQRCENSQRREYFLYRDKTLYYNAVMAPDLKALASRQKVD